MVPVRTRETESRLIAMTTTPERDILASVPNSMPLPCSNSTVLLAYDMAGSVLIMTRIRRTFDEKDIGVPFLDRPQRQTKGVAQ